MFPADCFQLVDTLKSYHLSGITTVVLMHARQQISLHSNLHLNLFNKAFVDFEEHRDQTLLFLADYDK